MKKTISIIEIPVADFQRAKSFYEGILHIKIETVTMDGFVMGLFPATGDGPAVQLVHGEGYTPSSAGAVIYFDGGDDLEAVARKIDAAGGKMVVSKTAIAPEMGYYALFMDTEGNRLGLHSLR